jgi:hypothetical protein
MSDNQLTSRIEKALPFLAYEFVDVAFTTPNGYVKVPHGLDPDDPYDVRYIITRKDKDCTISDNLTDTTSADLWTKRYIIIKSNQAPAEAELLLTIRKR